MVYDSGVSAVTLFRAYGIYTCQPWNWHVDPGGFLIQRPDELKWNSWWIHMESIEFGGDAVALVAQPKPYMMECCQKLYQIACFCVLPYPTTMSFEYVQTIWVILEWHLGIIKGSRANVASEYDKWLVQACLHKIARVLGMQTSCLIWLYYFGKYAFTGCLGRKSLLF